MSLYDVHLVCRTALRDEAFREALNNDPAAALQGFDLSPSEHRALLAGDVGELYAEGAHEYVLMWLGRAQVLGLDIPEFMKRITAAEPHYVF